MVGRVTASVEEWPPDRDRFAIGMNAYLDICMERPYSRIILQDARAILGDTRFGEIEDTHSLALLRATLHAVQAQGQLQGVDIEILSQMVDAMLCRLGTTLSAAEGNLEHRANGIRMIETFLDAYWPRPAPKRRGTARR